MLQRTESGSLSPGARVGQYKVITQLGTGSYGDVYKVLDEDLGVPRALKLLRYSAATSHRERLLREARAMARVEHPNVVRVIHTVEHEGVSGLVLEFIAGRTLAELLEELEPTLFDPNLENGGRGVLPLAEVQRLGNGIISGVQAAHACGFLHRDLKPENVLLAMGSDGLLVPKVVDFGLAKDLLSASSGGGHTIPGTALGTPFYMSPEQWRNARGVDVRTDIWALGALLYQLATGRVPFPGVTAMEVADRIRLGRYEDPSSLRPGLPRGLVRAIRGALVVDRNRRLPDCASLQSLWSQTAPLQERTVVQSVRMGEQVTELTSARDGEPTVVHSARSLDGSSDDSGPGGGRAERHIAALTLVVAGTIGALSGMGFIVGYAAILVYRALQGSFG